MRYAHAFIARESRCSGLPHALSIGAMDTFSDSAATALQLIAGADPMLLSIVTRSLAVSGIA